MESLQSFGNMPKSYQTNTNEVVPAAGEMKRFLPAPHAALAANRP